MGQDPRSYQPSVLLQCAKTRLIVKYAHVYSLLNQVHRALGLAHGPAKKLLSPGLPCTGLQCSAIDTGLQYN